MPNIQTQLAFPPDLDSHTAYQRVFRPGRLTFGFIMPLEGYPDSPFPTLQDHLTLAKFADDAGFSALWMRDVPFYDPRFGDTGQMLDPMVYLGFLASQTKRITLGTTGMVLPLRDPIILSKQAASVDQLSGGRLLLGLSSGDRAVEYPAFGADYDNRAERYREAFALIKTVSESSFPVAETAFYGKLSGNLDLIPKPFKSRIPMIVVGRARQDLSWIAEESDGWIWHLSDFSTLPELLEFWRGGYNDKRFRPYGYATFFDLDGNPDAPLRRLMNGITVGRNALIKLWKEQERQGVNHVALNLKPLTRPAAEVMDEMAEFVLPEFPSE